jgi:hypothetical protein
MVHDDGGRPASGLFARALSQLKSDPSLSRIGRLLLAKLANKMSPSTVALLDHPIHQKQRWTTERPHAKIYSIIDKNRALYQSTLEEFLDLTDDFLKIPVQQTSARNQNEPSWINGWMPALDGVALYGYLVKTNLNSIWRSVQGTQQNLPEKRFLTTS